VLHPRRLPLALACASLAACSAPRASLQVLETPQARSEAPPPAAQPAACVLDGAGVFYVAGADPTRPLVRYADGQVGPLDHCAIRTANKLSRRIPPVYVNGAPIGFC
jgi:hypothetical protein